MKKCLRFEFLGAQYPRALEDRFDRILSKIDELWDRPQLHDYFSELIIDKRGGRQGFPKEVLSDILMLRDLREAETLRIVHEKESALRELRKRGLPVTAEQLIVAVKSGDQSLVDLFVQAGVNIHVADADGTPVLMLAMKFGYSIIANLLIKAGAEDAHLPLRTRFQGQVTRMEMGQIPAENAHVFSELTLAYHRLNLVLKKHFLP